MGTRFKALVEAILAVYIEYRLVVTSTTLTLERVDIDNDSWAHVWTATNDGEHGNGYRLIALNLVSWLVLDVGR